MESFQFRAIYMSSESFQFWATQGPIREEGGEHNGHVGEACGPRIVKLPFSRRVGHKQVHGKVHQMETQEHKGKEYFFSEHN